jgi:hypothetical protein
VRRLAAVVMLAVLVAACGSPDAAPVAAPVAEERTVGYKLAAIDGRLSDTAEYERRIGQAAERCGEDEEPVADKVVRARQVLDERGIAVTLLEVIEQGILASISTEQAGTLDCAEVLSLWIVLTIG